MIISCLSCAGGLTANGEAHQTGAKVRFFSLTAKHFGTPHRRQTPGKPRRRNRRIARLRVNIALRDNVKSLNNRLTNTLLHMKETKKAPGRRTSIWTYIGVGVLIILLFTWLSIADLWGDTDVAADCITAFCAR